MHLNVHNFFCGIDIFGGFPYNLIFNSLVAKNRYNLPFYGIYSGFFFFTLFGNLFPAFTFFLNVFHPAFRDELVVCPETAGIMQGIGQLVTFI